MIDITHLGEQLWIKLFCLALRSNLEDCPHARELFSHSFERYAGSPHHETVVFYSIAIEWQAYTFQDYVLWSLYSKICFAAGKKVAMAASAQHFRLSLCVRDCTSLLVPASAREICLAHPVGGSDTLVKLVIPFFNTKTGDLFLPSYHWSADSPCSSHHWKLVNEIQFGLLRQSVLLWCNKILVHLCSLKSQKS